MTDARRAVRKLKTGQKIEYMGRPFVIEKIEKVDGVTAETFELTLAQGPTLRRPAGAKFTLR